MIVNPENSKQGLCDKLHLADVFILFSRLMEDSLAKGCIVISEFRVFIHRGSRSLVLSVCFQMTGWTWNLEKVALLSLSFCLFEHFVPLCICAYVCVHAQSLFLDPMVCSLPGSSVHVISQARILE